MKKGLLAVALGLFAQWVLLAAIAWSLDTLASK